MLSSLTTIQFRNLTKPENYCVTGPWPIMRISNEPTSIPPTLRERMIVEGFHFERTIGQIGNIGCRIIISHLVEQEQQLHL